MWRVIGLCSLLCPSYACHSLHYINSDPCPCSERQCIMSAIILLVQHHILYMCVNVCLCVCVCVYVCVYVCVCVCVCVFSMITLPSVAQSQMSGLSAPNLNSPDLSRKKIILNCVLITSPCSLILRCVTWFM